MDREEMQRGRVGKNRTATQATLGDAQEVRPLNQIEQLQFENDKLRSLVSEQETELLNVYRRLDRMHY